MAVNEGPRVQHGKALVPLHVIPKGGRDAVDGWLGPRLKVRVSAAPEKGKANKAVIALLAKEWKLPKSGLSVVSGLSARDKTIAVEVDADPGEWIARIGSLYKTLE